MFLFWFIHQLTVTANHLSMWCYIHYSLFIIHCTSYISSNTLFRQVHSMYKRTRLIQQAHHRIIPKHYYISHLICFRMVLMLPIFFFSRILICFPLHFIENSCKNLYFVTVSFAVDAIMRIVEEYVCWGQRDNRANQQN